MRNWTPLSVLMSAALTILLVGVPTQAIWAQEQPTIDDTEINFDVGGPEFDPNVQRVAPPDAVSGVFRVGVLVCIRRVLPFRLSQWWGVESVRQGGKTGLGGDYPDL